MNFLFRFVDCVLRRSKRLMRVGIGVNGDLWFWLPSCAHRLIIAEKPFEDNLTCFEFEQFSFAFSLAVHKRALVRLFKVSPVAIAVEFSFAECALVLHPSWQPSSPIAVWLSCDKFSRVAISIRELQNSKTTVIIIAKKNMGERDVSSVRE